MNTLARNMIGKSQSDLIKVELLVKDVAHMQVGLPSKVVTNTKISFKLATKWMTALVLSR